MPGAGETRSLLRALRDDCNIYVCAQPALGRPRNGEGDQLVHNFLHRTGILQRFNANHLYGLACYRPGGCADIIQAVAERIDARQFNPSYPQVFPRFVQHAIWRYCSQNGVDVCNGNQIDDGKRCSNLDCRMRVMCDCDGFAKRLCLSLQFI
jgi:hypothetical protein